MEKDTLALLAAFLLLVGCTKHQTEYFDEESFKSPGEGIAHAAADNQAKDISLVSLSFPKLEGLKDIVAIDCFEGNDIPFRYAEEGEERMVITLELAMHEVANPHLTFFLEEGVGETFTAQVIPEHKVSLYRDLDFWSHLVILRDHGVEKELEKNTEVVFLPEEFATLWIGNRVSTGARARFTDAESHDWLAIVARPFKAKVFIQDGSIHLRECDSLELEDNESIGIVVIPESEYIPIHLEVK